MVSSSACLQDAGNLASTRTLQRRGVGIYGANIRGETVPIFMMDGSSIEAFIFEQLLSLLFFEVYALMYPMKAQVSYLIHEFNGYIGTFYGDILVPVIPINRFHIF